jgi:hypothetical protein
MVLKRHRNNCAFDGCHQRRFLIIHHIKWWEWGGETDYDNLIPLCHFHHALVHDHGWGVMLKGDEAIWFRPGGRRFEPGPKESSESPAPEQPSELPTERTSSAPLPAMVHHIESGDLEITRDASTRALLKLGLKRLL